MKNKTYLFLGALIMGMAFAPLWASDAEAAKLAASLNALKARSAAAEGATVRLTGEARLTKSFAVPSGVTLDITAEGASLRLEGGAKLTVDGVVNARGHGEQDKRWVDGGLRVDGGPAVISGSGTINLASKGCLLNIHKGSKKFTLDGVTLVGLKDNDRSLVQVGEGGAFILKSGRVTGNTVVKGSGGGVRFNSSGTFTMSGGMINENTAVSGGGVWGENGTFTMEGGMILGNSASSNGGGVAALYECAFTMKGGEISNNSAGEGGGGVAVRGNSVFTMEGGTIAGNTADNYGAGGVFVATKMFTLKGGRIQGSTDSDGFAKNTAGGNWAVQSALSVWKGGTAKWGAGGTYTKGGVPQSGGGDITSVLGGNEWSGTSDTLIAAPKGKR
jgi:hypothetical protein